MFTTWIAQYRDPRGSSCWPTRDDFPHTCRAATCASVVLAAWLAWQSAANEDVDACSNNGTAIRAPDVPLRFASWDVLFAEIAERVSGKSFREFTSERLFQPLGMSRTFFRDDFLAVAPSRADGYGCGGTEGSYRRFATNDDTVGSTGLFTTTRDLLRWQHNFDDRRWAAMSLRTQWTKVDFTCRSRSRLTRCAC